MKRVLSSRVLVSSLLLAFGVAGCQMGNVKQSEGAGDASCHRPDEREVAALFDRWNASLKTGDAHKVVDNYATRSILLPTVSDKPRLTPEEKLDYFEHFLPNKPSGTIDLRFVMTGCNYALDSGLYTFHMGATDETVHARYTFTYAWDNGRWLITSHHSSKMPESPPASKH